MTGTFAVLLGVAVLPVASASATPPEVACEASAFAATFDPGIVLLEARNVHSHVTYTFTGCVAPLFTGLNSGTATYDTDLVGYTCAKLAEPSNVTFTITWNTGETSVVFVQYTLIVGTQVLTGGVISGKFAGHPILGALQVNPLPVGACAALFDPTGVTAVTGLVTFNIL